MTLEEIGEAELVEKISRLLRKKDERVIVPPGDDAAVVVSPQNYSILTTDTLIEKIHFKPEIVSPYQLGYKALVVTLSDVAAMAGLPHFALVSLGLRPETEEKWIQEFYRGMLAIAEEYNLVIVGGDVSESEILTLNITIMGEVEPELLRRRSEARRRHKILVTGQLGAAAAGLRLLLNSKMKSFPLKKELKEAHLFPTARIAEARIASREGAQAMEDISDGLAREILNIGKASRVGAQIFASKIPIAAGVKEVATDEEKNPLELALAGGEDYELVFTAPPEKVKQIMASIWKETKTSVTEIGEITPQESGTILVRENGQTFSLEKLGYEHFKPNRSAIFLRKIEDF